MLELNTHAGPTDISTTLSRQLPLRQAAVVPSAPIADYRDAQIAHERAARKHSSAVKPADVRLVVNSITDN